MGLSFTIAAGPRQRNHYIVSVVLQQFEIFTYHLTINFNDFLV
jgi:hypothetical protein